MAIPRLVPPVLPQGQALRPAMTSQLAPPTEIRVRRVLLRQPDGFECFPPVRGNRNTPDLGVLDGDDGVGSQAQLEPAATSLPNGRGDAHEPASSSTDEFARLQVEVHEGLPQIDGPLQSSRVPRMPARPWNARIVLELDVLVQIPKRLGLERVIEVPLSETVESVAQFAEKPKIVFVQRVELGHSPGKLQGSQGNNGRGPAILVLLEHLRRVVGHGRLLRSTACQSLLHLSHRLSVPRENV